MPIPLYWLRPAFHGHNAARHSRAAGGAIGRRGMGIDHRLAPIELVEDRVIVGIAEPFIADAGHQIDAVGLQHVIGVLDLAKGALDVEDRQHRELAEPARMVASELGDVIVPFPSQAARVFLVRPNAYGVRQRDDGRAHAALFHVIDRLVERPAPGGAAAGSSPDLFGEEAWRRDVVVNVDAMSFRHLFPRFGRAMGNQNVTGEARMQFGAGPESAP